MPIDFRPRGEARYAHQKQVLRRIIETRGVCALLCDPGTGKTACVIDYASALALKTQRPIRVLVLAPLVALDSWVGQTAKYAAEGVAVWAEALGGSVAQRAEVLAARGPHNSDARTGARRSIAWAGINSDGYRYRDNTVGRVDLWRDITTSDDPAIVMQVLGLDSLSQRRAVSKSKTMADVLHRAVERFAPDVLVIDESHRIKSPRSNVSRAAARLGRLAPRRLILTGTVMPHSPMDVWAQWRFLEPMAFAVPDPRNPGYSKPMPYGQFEERYGVLGGWQGRQLIGFQNLGEMQRIMARNSIVVRKEDALDLPENVDITVPVHLDPRERAAYDSMKEQLAAVLAGGALATVPNRLAQMMRLRQITSGYLPDDSGVMQRVGDSKTTAVRGVVCDTLAGEQRVVVFAHFRQEIADIAAALAKSEPKTTVIQQITGDTPPKEREALRKRFGSDEQVRIILIAQMRTLSLAVNELVTASHAVYASLSERRDDWVQSRDRLHRIGQKRSVTFWNVLVPRSVDEVIYQAHLTRESVEDAVLRYIDKREDSAA